ncbi:islet cell autoantigen 1 isoform X1 [Mirounga leonina]|uniref:islet cell autoantigen 1 isoform X1 n=1 Tax=Mirounga leonina TaxID=9715 RepID=UPI00156C4661|nr:islet cell autoantigen 1 isoform X1 [Mirounga leonina]XP_034876513.1 islet cell autoantigen 1 isoform X1 [Mirounga leonina]XP_034876514.1 islet cell autoantigen 1 isoform X1 [Mirounga leonina]XP_034876515.1 islet cell autoantigen 1 isoform X1 [Mirounga leonina]XP_034876516.1 islet cell autoantigen 1 isoform X1 [Mirounga leonina]XP_034876517.1 islet cell autoantigen 1 isoform X1 [Mirounga leonina]XP_034876518.1 islet cell autoantigen 1 isoform X1 [Mirounga leonina]
MSGHKCSYPWDLQDRYTQDKSVVNKMQQKYWETKQAFIKATGKKEDEHVVASDADLDAKLELFHSIQRTCLDLSKAIVLYQKRICFLSQEENELGKFLRSQGFQDKTRAGKMMQATGKALCFSSQQRLALRNPLCRFHQEVETFRHRAISDTWLTVNRMEQCRTEYRGALLWMKDVSQELDPDLYKQMEKFRKVQTQVRLAKKSFDKLKMDVCQKVDLLGASRCNLLSHMLATYQTTLLHFWEKTSHTMAAIHESFKGYQPYEFTTLKSLQDPMKKLIQKEERKITQQESAEATVEEPRQLISLEDENQHKESSSFKTEDGKSVLSALDKSSTHNACSDELLDMKPEEGACLGPTAGTPEPEGADKDDLLLLSEIFNASSLDEGEFSKEWAAVFGDDRLKEPAPAVAPGEPDPRPQTGSGFLPSQLLDQNMKDLQASLQEPVKAASDLTAWFSLFADLDPLSNPDAVGKTDKEHELLNA